MAEVHYVTSPTSGAGKSHHILRQISEQGAVYYRLHFTAGDSPEKLPQLLEKIGFHQESQDRRALHVDVGAAPPETTAAILKLLVASLPPRDLIYVEFPSGHPLPVDLPDGHKEVVKDVELDMEEAELISNAGGGYGISWGPSTHLAMAAKFLLATKEKLFDFKSEKFQIGWKLETAPSMTPAELHQELRDTLNNARDFRILTAYTRVLGRLVELGEGWSLLSLRHLQEFDMGIKLLKHFLSLSMMDTARCFSVPRMTKRDLPYAWARRLCKAESKAAIRDKLPAALGGSRFDQINEFLWGTSANTDIWATLDAAIVVLPYDQHGVYGFEMLFPPHLDPKKWGTESVLKCLETNDKRLDWAQRATAADMAALVATTLGRIGSGAWQAPLQALPGFNNFLAIACTGYRCQSGAPTLLIERDPSGSQSSLISTAVAELLGYSQRPPLRFEQGSPPEEIASRLEESVSTAEGRSLLFVQWALSNRADLAVAEQLKGLLLDGFVRGRQKFSELLVIVAVVGLDYATAVEQLPTSLVNVAWPLHKE